MIEEIKNDLGANYSSSDNDVLQDIFDEVSANALSFSKQEDINKLSIEIKQCVKSIYLRRGTEHNSSLSASGESSNFIDPFEEMRNNIVKNGKRRIY